MRLTWAYSWLHRYIHTCGKASFPDSRSTRGKCHGRPARRSTSNTITTRGIGASRGLFKAAKRSVERRRDVDKRSRDILPKHQLGPQYFATTPRRWKRSGASFT
jgi:hypothetical protein